MENTIGVLFNTYFKKKKKKNPDIKSSRYTVFQKSSFLHKFQAACICVPFSIFCKVFCSMKKILKWVTKIVYRSYERYSLVIQKLYCPAERNFIWVCTFTSFIILQCNNQPGYMDFFCCFSYFQIVIFWILSVLWQCFLYFLSFNSDLCIFGKMIDVL